MTLANTTHAIQFDQNGGPEVLKYREIAIGMPAAGEVRIKHHAVGLNYIDIYFRNGLYPAPQLPSGLGFEASGVVEAVGEGVTVVAVGDRVAYGQGPLGAYSQSRVMPVAQVVRIPDAVSFEQGAAMMLKGMTVEYLFNRTYALKAGDTILFHAAAGGVGLIACQWAKALGVKLIGTVSSPEKAALAKAHGAWETIDYSKDDVAKRVLEITEGKKVQVVYDGVGKSTWLSSLDSIQPRGLMVSYGNASGAVDGVNLGILAAKGSLYVTRPTLATHVSTRAMLEQTANHLFSMVAQGKVNIEINRRYALKDAAQAQIDLAGRGTTGAGILLP